MKKAIAFILCAGIMLTLIGCTGMLDAEYSTSEPHMDASKSETSDMLNAEVENYTELRNVLIEMIDTGKTGGTVRFISYEGDAEEDMAEVCLDVLNNTALGAYAVSHINFSIEHIVTYHEADISMMYRKTEQQVKNIEEIESREDLYNELEEMFANSEDYLAVKITDAALTAEDAEEMLAQAYYSGAGFPICMPETHVQIYPEDGEEKIIEAEFAYPFTDKAMQNMKEDLSSEAEKIARRFKKEDAAVSVLNLCLYLAESIEEAENEDDSENLSSWNSLNTAYGALIEKRADSEGFAIAFKRICGEMDIECQVVIGKYNGKRHAWNIVKIGDDRYHIDVSNCAKEGIEQVFLKTDSDMQGEYRWDSARYAPCTGELTYYDIA